MVKDKSRSYYIYDKFLNLWIFKYTSNKEIIYELYNNQHQKIHSAILAKECRNDFIVNIGVHNDIHIVARKISGEVLYYFFNGKKWSTTGLFHLNQHKDAFKLLGLYPWENKPHILYTIQNGENTNSWMIVDLYWENNKWNHVKVFQNNISPSNTDITTNQDDHGNIYLVCRWWDSEDYQLQFCQLDFKANLWNQHSLTFKKGIKYAPTIFAINNAAHTSWVYSTDSHSFSLYYRKKGIPISDSNPWNKERELYVSNNKIEHPFFAYIEGVLTLIWREGKKILYLETENNGDTWNNHPKLLANIENPEFIFFVCKNQTFKNRSYYIILDTENKKNYPFHLFKDTKKSNRMLSSPLYPSSRPEKSIEKKQSLAFKRPTNTFKNQFLSKGNSQKSSNDSNASFYAPPQDIHQKQLLKENLRSKIIVEENTKLKASISEYKRLIDTIQKDIESLRNEVGHLDAVNKSLQNDIKHMKESSLGYKINKLFKGD